MARTAITVQSCPPASAITPTYAAADAANGMLFVNDGRTQLRVRNADTVTHTVTAVSVADSFGRTGDVGPITVPAASGGVPGEVCFGDLDPGLFNQRSTDLGSVYVNFSAATGMTVAAIKRS